jgi:hypothetical protein
MVFRYTVKMLLEVKEWFKTHPGGIVKPHGTWPPVELDEEGWHRWFRECLARKINRNEKPRGRKDCPEWRREIERAARDLNRPRLIIHWLPSELRERFAHRLWAPEEE